MRGNHHLLWRLGARGEVDDAGFLAEAGPAGGMFNRERRCECGGSLKNAISTDRQTVRRLELAAMPCMQME